MTDDSRDPIETDALEWFVRMRDENVAPADHAAFEAWLKADPAHAAAIERARALWDRYDIVKPEYERLQRERALSRRRVVLGGLTALVAVPSAYYLTPSGLFADYSTGIAERRSFRLADGSEVELGSYSALSLDFTPQKRTLVLHRGQGYFRVAPVPSRPFVVEAGRGSVEALGTEFDVKVLDQQTTVAVIEHSVAVRADGYQAVPVPEGMQVGYGRTNNLKPSPFDAAAVGAWRRDRMVFEDVPLHRVLKELERYRRGRIVLLDRSLGDIPVTAVLDTKSSGRALDIIADTLPIRVVDAAGYIAVVYAR
ncbi:MAG: FecR domain-containing protein [Hyphomicrobiaceae bacterium]